MSKKWEAKVQHPSYQWYKALRPFIFERDKRVCQLKIEGVCTYRATEVHHIYGVQVDHWEHPDELQAVCKECNGHVGDPVRFLSEQIPGVVFNFEEQCYED